MTIASVIPAAGLGTRMVPFSKEVPKEMLPVTIYEKGFIVVKPLLHYIFESLYSVDVRTFFFIVGRGKRVIEDYFTPDWSYVDFLRRKGKEREANILEELYRKLGDSSILFINQPMPCGFGDAVLRSRDFMTSEYFIVHAGDDITYPDHIGNIKRLIQHYEKEKPAAVFLYTRADDPWNYGVVLGEEANGYMVVQDIVEKPRKPSSENVVVAIYVFNHKIYEALEETRPRDDREHQLTDAIKYLIDTGEKVHAIPVQGERLDLGTPSKYYKTLKTLLHYNDRGDLE